MSGAAHVTRDAQRTERDNGAAGVTERDASQEVTRDEAGVTPRARDPHAPSGWGDRFSQAHVRVVMDPRLSDGELRVLLYLRARVFAGGEGFSLSQDEIAKDLDRKWRAVHDAVKALCALGYIRKVATPRGLPARYALCGNDTASDVAPPWEELNRTLRRGSSASRAPVERQHEGNPAESHDRRTLDESSTNPREDLASEAGPLRESAEDPCGNPHNPLRESAEDPCGNPHRSGENYDPKQRSEERTRAARESAPAAPRSSPPRSPRSKGPKKVRREIGDLSPQWIGGLLTEQGGDLESVSAEEVSETALEFRRWLQKQPPALIGKPIGKKEDGDLVWLAYAAIAYVREVRETWTDPADALIDAYRAFAQSEHRGKPIGFFRAGLYEQLDRGARLVEHERNVERLRAQRAAGAAS